MLEYGILEHKMVGISIKPKIDVNFRLIDSLIKVGMQQGAKSVAEGVSEDAKKILEASAKNSSGVLAGAISAKNADTGLKSLARYDVVVDTRKAPYALWVEVGRNAGDALPYAKSGKKDYSKSRFTGHHYLERALEIYKEGDKATQIVAQEIIKTLTVLGG